MQNSSNIQPIDNPPKRLNKRQRKFMDLWLGDPTLDTYGNAYQSAIEAGFSDTSARTITGKTRNLQWIQDGIRLYASLEPEHIYLAMQKEALASKASRDRLKALELMAKIRGMFIDRNETKVAVTFTNAVPRPTKAVIDVSE